MSSDATGSAPPVIVITGANSGVGLAAAKLLAVDGATVVMVCRHPGRARDASDRLRRETGNPRVDVVIGDLGSLPAVRAVVDDLTARYPAIAALVNNAGVYRSTAEQTADGFEMTMGVNHVGHFVLTLGLIDALRAGGGRVIAVSSEGHRRGNLRRAPVESILRGSTPYAGLQAYCDSKLANVLFAVELARRFPDVPATAVHPGVLATRIWNQNRNPLSLLMRVFKPLMGRPRAGGRAVTTALRRAPEAVIGRYFNREREERAADAAYDPDLARDLWDTTQRLVGAVGT